MAWLQNLAGRAEDLLNKVDQNAGRVLNESIVISPKSQLSKQPSSSDLNGMIIEPQPPHHIISLPISQSTLGDSTLSSSVTSVKIDLTTDPEPPEEEHGDDVLQVKQDMQDRDSVEVDASSYSPFERVKSMTDSIGIMSVSSSNSLNIDLAAKLEAQLAKSEAENEQLSKEILNLQHVHSELQHDHSNLQGQLDRATDAVLLAQNEMQEYRARARRLLEDREKALLPSLQQEQSAQGINNEIVKINQELKIDLDKEFAKNQNLEARLTAVSRELTGLQQQYLSAQKDNQRVQETLRNGIAHEKRAREDMEEEHRQTTRELQKVQKTLTTTQRQEASYKTEIHNLEGQLKYRIAPPGNPQDTQLQSLTQMLMQKQSALDTLTSERNALRIQLEKAQQDYQQLELKALRVGGGASRPVNITHDYDDSRIPRLMQVSPLDAGVTQRVKHAYSTLDTFSIRTGVFLRRYPLARIFLICYMVMVHLWVLLILLTYAPGPR